MEIAIAKAKHAKTCGMRPFGAIILNPKSNIIGIGVGSETKLRPTRHSEILAIDMACHSNGDLLYGCTLISTHQPCIMCVGAILHSKISHVIFGSWRQDLPGLFRGYTFNYKELLENTTYPPRMRGGFMQVECVALFDDELKTSSGNLWTQNYE